MPFPVFPELQTDRLLLRRLKATDWPAICYLRTDPEVNKYVDRPAAKTKEDALAFIAKIDSFVSESKSYYWAITYLGNDTMLGTSMLGSICLWNLSDDRKYAEVGYDLNLQVHGKGIMSESLMAVLKFAFNELHMETIEAYTHHVNKASVILLKHNGFTLVEGKKDAGNKNNIVFAIHRA